MAKLTSGQRKSLPASDFVFPKTKKYPIEDASHARNALSRVSQNGTSSQKAAVRSAVSSKYPQIDKNTARVNALMERVSKGTK